MITQLSDKSRSGRSIILDNDILKVFVEIDSCQNR